MASQEKLERIERYLLGEMEGQELQEFSRSLSEDQGLATEVELQRVIMEAVREEDTFRFQQTLKEIQAEKDEKGTGRRRLPVRRHLSVAASIAILLLAAYFIYGSLNAPPSPQELFAQYFEIPDAEDILPPEPSSRGEDSTMADNPPGDGWSRAKDLFRDKQYAAALNQLRGVSPPEGPANAEFYFQLGILFLINGQPEQALQSWEQLEPDHSYALKWYRAMALLQLERRPEAKGVLRELAQIENPWQEQAAELLGEL